MLVRGSTAGTLSSEFTASASPSAPGSSVTDENGRFHHVRNAYVADRRVISDRGPSESSSHGLTLAARKAAEAIA